MSKARAIDLVGRVFGRLKVLSRQPNGPRYKSRWLCRCVCGVEKVILGKNLLIKNTQSCGCLQREAMSRDNIDLTGQAFGRLTVISRQASDAHFRNRWLCRCACGIEKVIRGEHMTSGLSKSCGCLQREVMSQRSTHGLSRTREYRIWLAMKGRCLSPNHSAFADYGGRGITVAPDFLHFESFFGYVGPCPPNFSLDRIDVNGNYEPGNVRWASQSQQNRNTRVNSLVTFNGKSQTEIEWSEELGIPVGIIHGRLRLGWPVEQALTAPKGTHLKSLGVDTLPLKTPRHQQRKDARAVMSSAIASGRLTPQPCEVCGNHRSQGHHTDYSNPLMVNWLCRKHHEEADKKTR